LFEATKIEHLTKNATFIYKMLLTIYKKKYLV